jgi:hypothetical protein
MINLRYKTILHSTLARLRGFEGVAMRKCLQIKLVIYKVFTTAPSSGHRS